MTLSRHASSSHSNFGAGTKGPFHHCWAGSTALPPEPCCPRRSPGPQQGGPPPPPPPPPPEPGTFSPLALPRPPQGPSYPSLPLPRGLGRASPCRRGPRPGPPHLLLSVPDWGSRLGETVYHTAGRPIVLPQHWLPLRAEVVGPWPTGWGKWASRSQHPCPQQPSMARAVSGPPLPILGLASALHEPPAVRGPGGQGPAQGRLFPHAAHLLPPLLEAGGQSPEPLCVILSSPFGRSLLEPPEREGWTLGKRSQLRDQDGYCTFSPPWPELVWSQESQ